MSEQPKVVVVGCGYWGSNIARDVASLGALAAVVDPSEAGRSKAEKLAPGVPTFADIGEALEKVSFQAAMIATPPETHHGLARRLLEAGKDCFVEKPLTVDLGEASDLIHLAHERSLVLMVGHVLEYHPAILRLRKFVEQGVLGKLRYIVSNRLNLGKIRTEESALWSFAPHDVSVILRLVGESPFEVVATGGCYITPNVADVTVTQLLFDNGVRAHIFVSWLHPSKEQKLVVIGSERMATFDDVTKELLLYDLQVEWHRGEPVPVRQPGIPIDYPSHSPLIEEIRHFLECVEHRRSPRTDGENGLHVLGILHASQRSIMTNGSPVMIQPTQFRSHGGLGERDGRRS